MHIGEGEGSKAHLGRCHLKYRRSKTDGTKTLNDELYSQRYRITELIRCSTPSVLASVANLAENPLDLADFASV